ncbi:hypothetical protein, partial [Lamprocystis purpurea]|uniref:hypothetical protein n=1 Tax=Lamprocystis purpurea TaxID=61598 RepID=UPI001B7FAEB5
GGLVTGKFVHRRICCPTNQRQWSQEDLGFSSEWRPCAWFRPAEAPADWSPRLQPWIGQG